MIKIYNMDVLHALKQMPDESVDMQITSPPYWGLRDYGEGTESIWGGDNDCDHDFKDYNYLHPTRGNRGEGIDAKHKPAGIKQPTNIKINICSKCEAWKGKLGLEPDFNLFIKHLCDIFDEVKRVLKKDGTCWVNLGDTYYTKSGSGFLNDNISSNEKVRATGINIANEIRGRGLLPSKCLTCIPERFMIEMINRGWILRNKIIWHKPNHMPTSVKDRFANSWEYLYMFSKSKKYYFDLDAVRERHLSTPTMKNGITSSITKQSFISQNPVTISDKLFSTIKTFYSSTRNTPLLSSTNIRNKLSTTLFAFLNNLNIDGFSKSSNVSLRFFPIMTTPTKSNKITQNISGIVIAEISQRFDMMDVDFSRFSTLLTFEISPTENLLFDFSPSPSRPISPTTSPVRISFFNSIDRTPFPITSFVTEIMFKDNRLKFNNGFSAKVTLHNSLSELTSFLSSPSFHKELKDIQLFKPCYPTQYKEKYNQLNDKAFQRKVLGIPHDLANCNPKGKNPDDVIDFGSYGDKETETEIEHRQEFHKGRNPEQFQHPLGKNPSDFWDITTRGYPEAHFAVFPEALVERPIKTTPMQICNKCGKARERITKTTYDKDVLNSYKSKRWGNQEDPTSKVMKKANAIHQTKGWTSCNCNAGFHPAVIMDIFAGSGTTLKVARRLNRDAIGIEIKKEYCDLIKKRLFGDNHTLFPEEFELIK